MAIILASASPRRRELLSLITPDFTVLSPDVDELLPKDVSGAQAVAILAKRKGAEIARQRPDDVVLGFDTVVEVDKVILGKPRSAQQAADMLKMLSGRRHNVHTGIYMSGPDGRGGRFEESAVVSASVWFEPLLDEEIQSYIATDEPYDKAGGYAIQGWASKHISRIDGDVFAVIGLPVCTLYKMMKSKGVI